MHAIKVENCWVGSKYNPVYLITAEGYIICYLSFKYHFSFKKKEIILILRVKLIFISW